MEFLIFSFFLTVILFGTIITCLFFLRMRAIHSRLSDIPNFSPDIFHIWGASGVAFDFKSHQMAFWRWTVPGLEVQLVPQTVPFSNIRSWQLYESANDNQINISILQTYYVRIFVLDLENPDIEVHFLWKDDAFRCGVSVHEAMEMSTTSIANNCILSPHKEPRAKRDQVGADTNDLDDVPPELVKNFVEHLRNNGFSRRDGFQPEIKTRFYEAAQLLWEDYGNLAGPGEHPDYGRQKVIRKALEPFFLRGPKDSKDFGYKFGTIRGYVSKAIK